MQLPRSAVLGALLVLDEATSTNDELANRLLNAPEFTVVLTTNQTSGRGRLGRPWVAEPGDGVAMSVLLRPAFAADRWGWVPLAAGVAMAQSVRTILPTADVGLKWPNDVQVHGLKVSGILTEVADGGTAIIVGVGANLETPSDRLPTPTATSLALEGSRLRGPELVDAVVSGWLESFRALYGELQAGTSIRSEVVAECSTIGRRVRVDLPGAEARVGTATGLDDSGRLLVSSGADSPSLAVAAGDVTHLRYE